MKTLLKGISILALTSALAFAGDDKDLKKIIEDQGIYVETAQKGVVLSGYVDTSYTYQFAGGSRNNNTPGGERIREGTDTSANGSSERAFRAFDRDNNDFNVNAFKLALEKPLPAENKLAAGFRADLMFGEDARILSARDRGLTGGSENQLFLEQAYVQFRVPVGNGLDFKFGKFVALQGYEVIESPANLNFSRGLLFSNTGPWTHTGVVASYKFNDIVDAQFGVANGSWDSVDGHARGIEGFDKTIMARVNITAPGKNANIANTFYYNTDGANMSGGANPGFQENDPVWLWDIWGNWAPKFADDKLLLGFNGTIGGGDDARDDNHPGFSDQHASSWSAVALYTKYQFTKMFSLAGRAEWLHGTGDTKFRGIAGTNATGSAFAARGFDVYSWTLTAGFNIWENLLTRVEYRYDWGTDLYINGEDQQQIAVNLVYTF